MLKLIKELIEKNIKEISSIFNELHENPELSFQEYNTSNRIIYYLDKYKIPYKRIGETSVIGIIEFPKEGKTIALRSDMDALPI